MGRILHCSATTTVPPNCYFLQRGYVRMDRLIPRAVRDLTSTALAGPRLSRLWRLGPAPPSAVELKVGFTSVSETSFRLGDLSHPLRSRLSRTAMTLLGQLLAALVSFVPIHRWSWFLHSHPAPER